MKFDLKNFFIIIITANKVVMMHMKVVLTIHHVNG